MKTRRIVLIFSLILCLGMLVACNADVAEQNAGDKLAYATFKNDSKDFSVAYDGYKSFDDLYWYYKANKLDAYGQSGDTGTFYAKVPGNTQTGKGLDGKTEALSEGKWQFTLMAFETALSETATGSKRYNAEGATQSAIYSGSTPASGSDVIVIRRNQTNYIPVTVTPVAGTGHIQFANAYYAWEAAGSVDNPNVKITITIPVSTTEYVITKELSYSSSNYPISGYIWLETNGTTGTIADSKPEGDYTNDIPAGVYAASIVITPVGNDDNIIFADQNLSLKVFGGLTATISGSLKELLSTENYFAVPEVDVKVFNPDPTSEAGTVITSNYVAKDEKTSETTTVTFPQGALTSTNQHSLEVEVFSAAISESKFEATSGSQAVAGLDLTLKKVTRTSEGAVKEETVEKFENSKYATIVTYINPGLEDVVVKYNGTGKDQPIASDTAETNVATVLSADSGLGYNPATGYLSFKTNHFSEYYVEATVYVQNATTGKYYHSLREAIDDAQDGQTIKLLRNISLEAELEIAKSITLDFGGYNITAINHEAIWVSEGIVTLSGTGTISANKDDNKPGATSFNSEADVIFVGSQSGGTIAGLVIGSNVVVSSNHCYGVVVCGKETQGQTLDVYGTISVSGVETAISGNGNAQNTSTKIVIEDGAVITSSGNAIYHPQAGSLSIGAANITGGIEIKSGNTTIAMNGPTVTANGLQAHNPNNDGCSTTGYAVAVVENSAYKGNANVVINGGSFAGAIGVVKDSDVDEQYAGSIIITGGTFNHNPSEYVAEGYVAVKIQENPSLWKVQPLVAKIVRGADTVYYGDLNKALSEVDNNETIILLNDVLYEGCSTSPLKFTATNTARKATLDLNGKKVLAKVNNNASIALLEIYGGNASSTAELTVKDSGNNGSLELTPMVASDSWNVTVPVVSLKQFGEFVLDGGTIRNVAGAASTSEACPYGIDILTTNGNAKCTINGGNVISSGDSGMGIRLYCNSTTHTATLIVNGGYIEGDGRGVWMQNPTNGKNCKGVIDINGGSIKADRAVDIGDFNKDGEAPSEKTLSINLDDCILTSTNTSNTIAYVVNNVSYVYGSNNSTWYRQNFDNYEITVGNNVVVNN